MKDHTDLINHLIQLRKLESYLEIGVFRRAHNLDKINCKNKIGVDPDPKAEASFTTTSDDFFQRWDRKMGLIFIDGLHHADQVKKDFENALRLVEDNGFIVLHDTNPHSERITHVPRDNGEWTGDVYKFACTLSEYDGIDFLTFDFDYGVTVVWKHKPVIDTEPEKVGEVTWERFEREKDKLLRLVGLDKLNLIPA